MSFAPSPPEVEMYEPTVPEPVQPEPLARSRRSGRGIRFPRRFDDFLPGSTTPLAHIPTRTRVQPASESPSLSSAPESPELPAPAPPARFDTVPDAFGLYRSYPQRPTVIPDQATSLASVCDSPTLVTPEIHRSTAADRRPPPTVEDDLEDEDSEPYYAPFSNPTAATLTAWQYTGPNSKSDKEMARLAHSLGSVPTNANDFSKFNPTIEKKRMDKYLSGGPLHPFRAEDGWRETSVKVRLPSHDKGPEMEAPEFEVKGVHHRNIVDVIKSVFSDPSSTDFHMTPFEHYWQPSEGERPQRVHGEAYFAADMLDDYQEIYSLPVDPENEHLERVIVEMMSWSDATHLANFGTASLWPVYLQFGNQSKYTRAKPTADACHHIAYMPQIPDTLQDAYKEFFEKPATSATLTHCKRELIHGIWEVLTDEEFVKAYTHGIVVRCGDGIVRLLFPRFYTYSADYPEKVLLATIKFLAKCPCPRCLVEKDKISQMGTKADMKTRSKKLRVDNLPRRFEVESARRLIFEEGVPVDSDRIKDILKGSGVPTRNAFSKFAQHGFNFHSMLVVDLLHEFELGNWKAIFIHLLRLLYAAGNDAIQELNKRYRAVPTFGRDTIRRFHRNASGMKKLAARDFEDLLQCAWAVFEGLLPAPHNKVVLDLIFDLSTWHALAKMRLHTDSSLEFLDAATTALAKAIRVWIKKTCAVYDTKELPQEEAARGRHTAALIQKNPEAAAARSGHSRTTGAKRKVFNGNTFKMHCIPDYAATIRRKGTTDSYSTQIGELHHKIAKRRFARTNKHLYVSQLAKLEARERLVAKVVVRMAQHIKKQKVRDRRDKRRAAQSAEPEKTNDPLPFTDPTARYHIAKSTRKYFNVTEWLTEHGDDPALNEFYPRLKDHLLARVLQLEYDGDDHQFSDEDRETVLLKDNRIYEHSVVRVNYTTYDVRRQQDSMNPRTHADVMVLSHEDEGPSGDPAHPYWYARVQKVCHAYVLHRGARSKSTEYHRMDFLWVRWYGLDTETPGGWAAKRPHGVAFIPDDDPGAFGFLDPAHIIRGVHLIPAFDRGTTTERLGPSLARRKEEGDEDYELYYVNMFVDRDMVMCFLGGGIGHRSTRSCDAALRRDRYFVPEDENSKSGEDSEDTDDDSDADSHASDSNSMDNLRGAEERNSDNSDDSDADDSDADDSDSDDSDSDDSDSDDSDSDDSDSDDSDSDSPDGMDGSDDNHDDSHSDENTHDGNVSLTGEQIDSDDEQEDEGDFEHRWTVEDDEDTTDDEDDGGEEDGDDNEEGHERGADDQFLHDEGYGAL
ncbi:hypothetical protein BV25DRAFT_1918740 [Artomyces pyxidatus]|uniref:Uncharacterized protein n=1 Tax=Artomyces pyxidatus TaxID=48021 RepID=A0ACB8SS36_9AGAM|nr:hypothetical protein BV25DRAFT_1918740 [Artomyces pyxidatus]